MKYLKEFQVEFEEVGRLGAVDIVPPVAHDVLLVEDRPLGAQEVVLRVPRLAHVEHLEWRKIL